MKRTRLEPLSARFVQGFRGTDFRLVLIVAVVGIVVVVIPVAPVTPSMIILIPPFMFPGPASFSRTVLSTRHVRRCHARDRYFSRAPMAWSVSAPTSKTKLATYIQSIMTMNPVSVP